MDFDSRGGGVGAVEEEVVWWVEGFGAWMGGGKEVSMVEMVLLWLKVGGYLNGITWVGWDGMRWNVW